ncbi:EAL domain-containing protein [Sphingopyxis sp. FBM22]|nr:EAL domain-containing protein [Sphingopyxis yananensis]
MSDRRRLFSTLRNVSPLSILGLAQRDQHWLELDKLQRSSLRHQTRFSLFISFIMAITAGYLMLAHVTLAMAGVWLSALFVLGLWAGLAINQSKAAKVALHDGPKRLSINIAAVLASITWAAPFWFMGPAPPLSHSLAHWAVTLFVMMTFTILAHSLPLACILFVLPISLSATLTMMSGGHWGLALVALCSGLLLCVFHFHLAQNQLRMRVADARLREKLETVALLMRETEALADWMWQTDAQHRLEKISATWAAAWQSTPAALEGKGLLDLISQGMTDEQSPSAALMKLRKKMQKQDKFASLVIPVTVRSQKRWWRLSAVPRFDPDGKFLGYRGIGSDVTDQHSSAEHIARLARIDILTDLPNRLSVYEELAEALNEARSQYSRCAMLIINLDRFKIVNDTLSHAVGDQLLAQVAHRLRSVMEAGCSCGRLGSDEFAIIIRRPDSHTSIKAYARHVIAALSRPYQVDGHKIFIGASAGYALGPADGENVETLSRNADLALYKCKSKGGNSVEAFAPILLAQAEERSLLEQELRSALEKRELQIYYQPVVSAHSEQLVSFEALLRWNSAKLGPVAPSRFVPIAEESRLIHAIGEWVLRTACHEAMSWPAPIKVAVNVSSEQLTNAQFPSIIMSALTQSGLPPHRLEIEVTESLFLHDGGGAVQILDQLLAIGVRLSLDDFGTGYSSFGYLRKARFSAVKVDRSFVSSAAKGSVESIAIIRAVVALADGLGMTTIAEGAETAEEVATVRDLGCRHVQGYYFGRPMTPASIRQYFPAAPAPILERNKQISR